MTETKDNRKPEKAKALQLQIDRSAFSSQALWRLLSLLNADGEEMRVVGGAVRDLLLRRPVRDFDCATTALPEVVVRRTEAAGWRCVPTGLAHGTVTVIIEGASFEVTTLREDIETDGRHATVRFTRSFEADARRRDFTINGLSLSQDGVVYDSVGGLADLERGHVRFIGDPCRRIAEDALRSLRLFRFHAEYGRGPIDREGFKAAIQLRHTLGRLSGERIRTELFKLLQARNVVSTVREVTEAGFLSLVLAGVTEQGRFEKLVARSKLNSLEPANGQPLSLLAALAVVTVEDADRLRLRLRLSNHEHAFLLDYARLLSLVKSRLQPLDGSHIRALAYRYGLSTLALVFRALDGEPKPILTLSGRTMLDALLNGQETVPVSPVTGANLVESGLAPGPRVGIALSRIEEKWLEAGMPNDVEGIVSDVLRSLL